jgi:cellulose synthase/poly-beta-1,6-N-acetylglucosamine synthase-like glycosyltransferase
MTQLRPEAARGRAAGEADEAAAQLGSPPTGQSSQAGAGNRRGRNRAAACAVVAVIAAIASAVGAGLAPWWAAAAVAVVTAVYLAAIVFNLVMVFYGSARMALLSADETLPDGELPVYTVLVPLAGTSERSGTGRSADPIADLIADMSALDYPTDRLQVLLLAADGAEYATAALPANFEIVAVGSPSQAGACAVGLARARGVLCVVFKPGQRPDRGQLRAAASSFSRLPAWVVGIRPETRFRNPRANWLTQYVAAESAVRSVLFVRGLDRLQLPVPAGGFSCHYRTDALRRLGAWQDGDLAEGADIGVRIARRGWTVRVLASVTGEEAEGRLDHWLRQRAASIRDDYRSWLAQTRSTYRLWRDLGPLRFTAFQLTTVLFTFTALANPLLWLLTLLWLAGGSHPVAGVFPPAELYTVITVLLLGNLFTAYSLMIGCMEHGLFAGVRMMLLAPVYMALTSLAAYRALLPLSRPEPARAVVPSAAAS